MSNTRYISITKVSDGTQQPAEVRTYLEEEKLVVLSRDFDSGHLTGIEFIWKDKSWISTDGKYQCDYTFDKTMNDVTVRVPKNG
jgi:hypothetical protein